MSDFFNSRTVTAQKSHVCDLCECEIKPGESYQRDSGRYGGYFFDQKLHHECKEIIFRYFQDSNEDEYNNDIIFCWWIDNYCQKCKHYYPVCKPDAECAELIRDGKMCPDNRYGRCRAGDTVCEPDRGCWCTRYEEVSEE